MMLGEETLQLIVGVDAPEMSERRALVRASHLAHAAKSIDRIRIAGPLVDDVGNPIGSMFIVAMSAADARSFALGDPYATEGVFASVTVRGFSPLIGPT